MTAFVPQSYTDFGAALTALETRIASALGSSSGGAALTRVSRLNHPAIPNSTETSAIFDTEEVDALNGWVVGTPERITFTAAGVYAVFGSVQFASGTQGERYLGVRKNGLTPVVGASGTIAAASATVLNAVTFAQFAANDYIEARVYHSQGTSLGLLFVNLGAVRVA